MAEKYIIGIDAGSQSSKTAIYDLCGNVIISDSEPLKPLHLAEGGVVEHPDDDMWDSICVSTKRLMSRFEGDSSDIIGVGLCTIRFCRCLLKKDGTLAQPALSWMDSRLSRPHEEKNPDIRYVTASSGYITHRFTGELRDTVSNYLGMWPLDMDNWDYYADDGMLRKYNLTRDMLPQLQMPATILGTVTKTASGETGIPAGLPVVATANDKAVEALGVGCVEDGTAVISLGTYIASMTPGAVNLKNPQKLWVNLSSMPNRYLYESNGIRRGMWMLSWWANTLGEGFKAQAAERGLSAEALLDLEAEKIAPGSDGLMVVPHWLAPSEAPFRKGMMLGFDGRHTRAHIFRAIMESIALTMKNNIDDMCAELGKPLDRVIVSGGGAKSDPFMQIFADVLNVPVSRPRHSGAAGTGAAICTAVALGVYDGFESAVAAMVRPGELFEPNEDSAIVYSRLNTEVYRELTTLGDEVFKKSYDIFG